MYIPIKATFSVTLNSSVDTAFSRALEFWKRGAQIHATSAPAEYSIVKDRFIGGIIWRRLSFRSRAKKCNGWFNDIEKCKKHTCAG